MIDNMIAGLLKVIEKHGYYPIFFGILVILFPALAVIAGSGYAWYWGFFHAALMMAAILLPSWTPPYIRVFAKIIGYTAAIILFFGIFNATKPLGITLGLAVNFIGLVYIGAIASSLALTYGLFVAPTSDETVESAQERGKWVVNQFISIAAWELCAAWYITTLGQYLSLTEGIFILCAAGIILYGGIAWNLLGNAGRYIIYYAAIAGFGLKTIHAIYRLLMSNEIVDGNIALSTRLTDFLKAAVQINVHSLEWFMGIASILAIAFLVSSLTGKKVIVQMTAKILGVIFVIAFIAWFGWFDGMGWIEAKFAAGTSLGFKGWALILITFVALGRMGAYLTDEDIVCQIPFYASVLIATSLVVMWIGSWPHPVLSIHTWDAIVAAIAPEDGLNYPRISFWIIAVVVHVAIIWSGLRRKVDRKRKVYIPGAFPVWKVLAAFLLFLLFDWMWWNGGSVLLIRQYALDLWGPSYLYPR